MMDEYIPFFLYLTENYDTYSRNTRIRTAYSIYREKKIILNSETIPALTHAHLPIHKILGCCFSAMVLKKVGSSASTLAAQILFFSNKPSKLVSLTSNLLTLLEGKADSLTSSVVMTVSLILCSST